MEAAAPSHPEDVDALTYLPLVGHVVHQLAARYPRGVDRTAMWNAGAAGLLYAVRQTGTRTCCSASVPSGSSVPRSSTPST